MPHRSSIVALAILLAILAGCGGENTPDDPASEPTPRAPARAPAEQEIGAGRLVREHLSAVERDDVDGYLAAVADDASFDIGGRMLSGRDAVRDFFEGELAGGRYEVLRERASPGGVTFDLDFRREGLFEELTYAYGVRGGRITGLVGRYR